MLDKILCFGLCIEIIHFWDRVKAWIHLGVVARQWFYFIYAPNLWFILFIAVIVACWFAKTNSLFVLTTETH